MTVNNSGRRQHHVAGMSLYAREGARKHLNTEERMRFLRAAKMANPETETLCMTLTYTGCRISEALALSAASIQRQVGIISFCTLKKRDKLIIREVPVPGKLISVLERVHGISESECVEPEECENRLWPWSRTWAWMQVKAVMAQAHIYGRQASPKGLRHGFGVHAVRNGVPLNLVQRWLGHAQLSTTAIYADVVGPEEIAIAERMW